jgi:hypothetical protein
VWRLPKDLSTRLTISSDGSSEVVHDVIAATGTVGHYGDNDDGDDNDVNELQDDIDDDDDDDDGDYDVVYNVSICL